MSLVAVVEVSMSSDRPTAETYEDGEVTKLRIDFGPLRVNVDHPRPIKLARLAQAINEIFND